MTQLDDLDQLAAPGLRGLSRQEGHPLTVTEIAQILKRIDTSAPIGSRDRAVILLGYASATRPGEVSALDVGDIITKPAGILMSAAPRPIRTLAVGSSVSLAATIDLPTRSGRSTTGSASARLDRARSSPA